jgi:hypothetical protein
LQARLDDFRKQGLGVAAISYDSPGILRNFAERMKISYPLLSDRDSATIRAFGLLNTQVPRNSPQYGVPHPGMYIVGADGKVKARYFEKAYQERFTPDTILAKEFGVSGIPVTEIRTEHLTITASQSQNKVRGGNRVTLTAEFALPPEMHLYAPGVRGYRPVEFNVEPNPALTIHQAGFPKPQVLFLPAIKERVPVYAGKFRITRDVTVAAAVRDPAIELKGTIEYQACDDKICYLPKSVPLRFSLVVEAHDRERVPEALRRKPPGF